MAVSQNKVVTAQGLNTGNALCTAAKTDLSVIAGAVKLFTAGPNGAVLYSAKAEPRVTVTATQLQLYRSRDAGVTLNLMNLTTMAAYTLAATTSPPITDFLYSEANPLRLAANEEIWAAIGVAFAGGIMFDATGENL
jgi:hypothetical protein